MKNFAWGLFLSLTCVGAYAQTPTDGFIMQKGEICIASTYQTESWDHYWEGTFYRDNPNLGTLTTNSWNNMFALGILNKVNLIAMLPYVSTQASAGTSKGHQGWQDLGVWLKAKPFETSLGNHHFEAYVTGGISTPASAYYPDYLPFSIGLGSTVISGRGAVHFQTAKGIYIGAQGGYSYRSNIHLERTNYFTDRSYTTEEVLMPNVADYSATVGYFKGALRLEASYAVMNTLGGNDMRRNEPPFPANNMDRTSLNFLGQYRFPFLKGLGLTTNAAYVLSGRNVGKSLMFGGGVLYQFMIWNKQETAN